MSTLLYISSHNMVHLTLLLVRLSVECACIWIYKTLLISSTHVTEDSSPQGGNQFTPYKLWVKLFLMRLPPHTGSCHNFNKLFFCLHTLPWMSGCTRCYCNPELDQPSGQAWTKRFKPLDWRIFKLCLMSCYVCVSLIVLVFIMVLKFVDVNCYQHRISVMFECMACIPTLLFFYFSF